MFSKILIANRGEIACRVIGTARRMGVRTVAVFSDADAHSMHVAMADEAVHIGASPVGESYLRGDRIIEAALSTGAQAIHPGYGFLSENPEFADKIAAAGLVFIGPSADSIRAMGLKDAAKRLMEKAGVPVVPGWHGDGQALVLLAGKAREIGYPVLIKARAGGGGRGMRRVEDPDGFADALAGAQRRHQKVIEEAPAPGMTAEMRAAMTDAAVKAALAIGYSGAGTVEFIVDASEGLRPDRFWFMEMNTRLQVEHPVTEMVTGVDLVEWQLRVAAGEPLPLAQEQIRLDGHAFEARIYAEDAAKGFLPATGTLHHLRFPPHAPGGAEMRVETGVRQGDAISPFYDPMIAKLVVKAPDRAAALSALVEALGETEIAGTIANIPFLVALASDADFSSGDVDTGLIGRKQEELTRIAPPSPRIAALAALSASGAARGNSSQDPWDALAGYAHFHPVRRRVDLRTGTEEVSLHVTARRDGRYEIAGADGAMLAAIETQAADARTARWPGHVTVFEGAVGHSFAIPDPFEAAEEAAAGGDALRAPMPGLVKIVRAAAGDSVAKGQALLVLEAMKMEHTISAPHDGMIEEIAAEGAQVSEGTVLVRFAEG